jgi:membrane-bound metal-dependent hydrolase YbcI (DUF457 family)
MDIATHAGIGLIGAAPMLNSHPELGLGFVAGSVLPDLDAMSRVFGKKAFLRSHQTWTHALPIHGLVSVVAGLVTAACGADGFLLGAGLFAGLAIHTLLDLSNTLGVTLITPFSRKRFCLEWVFFVDAFVLALTFAMTSISLWLFYTNGEVPLRYAGIFFAAMAGYFGAKGILRRRCGLLVPGTVTLMPSALWPWRFFGVSDHVDFILLFSINAITGKQETIAQHEVLDALYERILTTVPEFHLMRGLSPAYHVVSAKQTEAGEMIRCRDLRTRNFKTNFGDLEIWLDVDKNVVATKFHV